MLSVKKMILNSISAPHDVCYLNSCYHQSSFLPLSSIKCKKPFAISNQLRLHGFVECWSKGHYPEEKDHPLKRKPSALLVTLHPCFSSAFCFALSFYSSAFFIILTASQNRSLLTFANECGISKCFKEPWICTNRITIRH